MPTDSKLETYIIGVVGLEPDQVDWAHAIGKKYPGGKLGEGDAARHLALGWLVGNLPDKKAKRNGLLAIQLRESLTVLTREQDRQDMHNNKVGFQLAALASTPEEAEKLIADLITSTNVTEPGTEEEDYKSGVPVQFNPTSFKDFSRKKYN